MRAGASQWVRRSRGAGAEAPRRRIWTTRRALVAHLVLLIWVAGCATASWWQVGIALSGDSLGWVYSVMWPCFAIFATVFWWFLLHDDPATLGRRGLERLQRAPTDERAPEPRPDAVDVIKLAEQEDPELAAYNAYLADLARADRAKSKGQR